MILHIISSLTRGGRERQLAGILKHTDAKAIVFNKSAISYEEEYDLTGKIFYLTSRNPVIRFFQMHRIIRYEKPAIIWSWGGFEATFAMLVSLITPARHINGSIRHGIVLFNRKQLWRKIILHLSRQIVANSHAGLKANGLKRGNVLYNGLDEKFFHPVDTKQYLAQNPEIGDKLAGNAMVLISVANLIPYKDYFTVLKAMEMVRNEGYDFIYLVVGEGPNRAVLEEEIGKRNLENHVFLLGRRQDVRELLALSDIFIHSSLGEGCSNAIIEAMAAGLSVIASHTGGTPEILDDSYGRLFEFKNRDQLKAHITRALENPREAEAMGRTAMAVARERFSFARMVSDYENIITEITK
ncbi:MAG: glycosyltransferase [Bacteroidales bacterium]|nr:glycosyltransferase [Bacteroidales bacterium]